MKFHEFPFTVKGEAFDDSDDDDEDDYVIILTMVMMTLVILFQLDKDNDNYSKNYKIMKTTLLIKTGLQGLLLEGISLSIEHLLIRNG